MSRLFFALVPDAKTRAAIWRSTRAAVAKSGGRSVPAANLHVTVAFLGDVDVAALQRAANVGPFNIGPFELGLSRCQRSPRGRVLWLAPAAIPAELIELEQTLWQQLQTLGFKRERRPFRPHMTLARQARAVDAEPIDLRWHVGELTLVESAPSERGRHYLPLASWPMGTAI